MHNEEGGRGRTDGRTWAIGLCLTVAVLFALASLQVLDVPQIGLTEPHKTIQKANVAEALLRLEKNQKSARLERTALEGGAPSSTLRAEPTGHLDGSVAGAPSTTPPGQSNASEPEMIWYDLPRRSPLNAQIDLVIAAFREDLSWINVMMEPMASDFALRLYCKGDRLKDPRCLRIDNFGGEEYAYLTHITHFYDDLAPITIFTLGSIYDRGWDWLKCRKLNFVLSQLDTPERRQNFPGFATMAHTKPDSFHEFEGFFTLTKYQNHAGGTKTASCRASITPLQKWFEAFINVSLAKARHTGVLYNPIFAVSRERIRQFPRSMYERLLREILRCTAKEHEGVAEAGHYLERAWKPMFETYIKDAYKCSGHFGQKKGDLACCNQTKTVYIELPWTICSESRPICSGFVDGAGWGTCMPADLGERRDTCPEGIRMKPK